MDYLLENVAGDVLLAAGYVAYLGPFTVSSDSFATFNELRVTQTLNPGLSLQGEYRTSLVEEWLNGFKEQQVPHTAEPNLINTLGDRVKIRSWQVNRVHKIYHRCPVKNM